MSDIKCRFGFLKKHGVFLDLYFFPANIMQWSLNLDNTQGPEITWNQMCNKLGLDNRNVFFSLSLYPKPKSEPNSTFFELWKTWLDFFHQHFLLLWCPDHRNIRQDAAPVVRLMKSRGFFSVVLDWFVESLYAVTECSPRFLQTYSNCLRFFQK